MQYKVIGHFVCSPFFPEDGTDKFLVGFPTPEIKSLEDIIAYIKNTHDAFTVHSWNLGCIRIEEDNNVSLCKDTGKKSEKTT